MNQTAALLKVRAEDLPAQVEKILAEDKSMRKQLDEVQKIKERAEAQKLLVGGEEIGNLKYLKGVVQVKTPDELRDMADFIIGKIEGGVLVLAAVNDGKVSLVVKADKKAVASGVDAGKIVKEISKLVGGGGGGRPDMAQAGGKNPDSIPQMFDAAKKILENLTK